MLSSGCVVHCIVMNDWQDLLQLHYLEQTMWYILQRQSVDCLRTGYFSGQWAANKSFTAYGRVMTLTHKHPGSLRGIFFANACRTWHWAEHKNRPALSVGSFTLRTKSVCTAPVAIAWMWMTSISFCCIKCRQAWQVTRSGGLSTISSGY